MELPSDYVSPLFPVLGVLNVSQETSNKLISKLESESFIEIIKLSHNWVFSKPETINSPNDVNSPLYPDGIMTPLWIQKIKANPGVVIGIYDLGFCKSKQDPLGVSTSESYRDNDSKLSALLNEKRRGLPTLSERGRKFIPIFVLLDYNQELSSVLEERIAFIRKTCTADKIFTIDVNSINDEEELKKFNKGLVKYLLDSLYFYYRECEKHIKKKKSKIGSITRKPSAMSQPTLKTAKSSELSPQGWLVRYDFKLGIFAEFRQDMEYAQRYLDSAYQSLSGMFKSSTHSSEKPLIIPFSARWFESRLLLDCINFRLCNSYLKSGAIVACTAQFSKHIGVAKYLPEFALSSNTHKEIATNKFEIKKLGLLPGGGSFEYWAWISSHYLMFANMLELQVENRLELPFPPIGSIPISISGLTTLQISTNAAAAGVGTLAAGGSSSSIFGPFSGINTAIFTQKPGFYLWIAAISALERAKRFSEAQKAYEEDSTLFLSQYSNIQASSLKQSLHAERSIDHNAASLALLEKAHNWFKTAKYLRLSLYLEFEIAKIYEKMNSFEVAINSYNNVANIYRQEKWHILLKSVLFSLMNAARRGGITNVLVLSLFEILSKQLHPPEPSEVSKLSTELFELIGQSSTLSTQSHQVLMIDTDRTPTFLESFVQIYQSQAVISEPIKFQLTIHPSSNSLIGFPIKLARIYVEFTNSSYNFAILNDENLSHNSSHLETHNSQNIAFQKLLAQRLTPVPSFENPLKSENSNCTVANLTLNPNTALILEGCFSAGNPEEISVSKVICVFESEKWLVGLCYNKKNLLEKPEQQRWFSDPDSSFVHLDRQFKSNYVRVNRKRPSVNIEFRHSSSGLLHDYYPITVSIENKEEPEVYLDLEVSIKSSDSEIDRDTQLGLKSDSQESIDSFNQHLKFSLGTIGIGTICKDVLIKGFKKEGIRTVIISVFWCLQCDKNYSDRFFKQQEVLEIPFINAFKPYFDIKQIPKTLFQYLDVVGPFKPSVMKFEKQQSWLISSKFQNTSSSTIMIKGIELLLEKKNPTCFIESYGLSDALTQMIELEPLEAVTCLHEVSLSYPASENQMDFFIGDLNIAWKKVEQDGPLWTTSSFIIPRVELINKSIVICINLKSEPQVGSILPVEIITQNTSLKVEEIIISLDHSDNFLFSGSKSCPCRILPFGTRILNFNMVPLHAGTHQLPTITISSPTGDEKDIYFLVPQDSEISGSSLSGYNVFVKPANM